MQDTISDPRILFEDTHVIVLDKPAGLLSQGDSGGQINLVDWLRAYLGRNYVGLIHRLDRNTSGVIVVAKRTKAAQRLSQSLVDGKLERTYRALLIGRLDRPARWAHPLLKDEVKNIVRVVTAGTPGAKSAILNVTPLTHVSYGGADLTLAEFQLETGRSHQIRAQAKAEGFPLLGDTKYALAGKSAPPFSRPALHSHRVVFPHPMTQERVELEAPLPEDMSSILKPTTY